MELLGHHMCPDFPKLPPGDHHLKPCKEKIIIIGAGIAGISAAKSLQVMGLTNVIVLEASDSVGGRLKSTTSFQGCPPLDVGAEWIHSIKGDGVLRAIMNFQSSSDDNLPKEVVPDLIEYKPNIYVKKWKNRLLTWIYKETKFKSTTWHHWFLSNFDSVIQDCVELNSPVANVDYSNHTDVVLTLEDGSTRTADRLICTAPMQVLKEDGIIFNPPLPTQMKCAIDAIEMPPGFRILFQVSEKFYEDITICGSLCTGELDELTAIYDPLWGKELTDKNTHVVAYVAIGNKNAGEMSELSDEELAKAALAGIDKHYDGQGSKYLIGEPVVQNWRAMPYVRGAYTFPAPQKYRKELGKSIGKNENGQSLVYFAGEHTSPKHHSLVPGAACEGRRAALEVAASLGIDTDV